jgi:hypothetical protein
MSDLYEAAQLTLQLDFHAHQYKGQDTALQVGGRGLSLVGTLTKKNSEHKIFRGNELQCFGRAESFRETGP